MLLQAVSSFLSLSRKRHSHALSFSLSFLCSHRFSSSHHRRDASFKSPIGISITADDTFLFVGEYDYNPPAEGKLMGS